MHRPNLRSSQAVPFSCGFPKVFPLEDTNKGKIKGKRVIDRERYLVFYDSDDSVMMVG